jgi:hypothetical protein
MVTHGVPDAQADLLIGLFRAARRGDFGMVDPTLGTLPCRPQTMRDVLSAAYRDRAQQREAAYSAASRRSSGAIPWQLIDLPRRARCATQSAANPLSS